MAQQSDLKRKYQQRFPQRVDYAQLGVSTALFGICGTIVAGAVAYARGNKAFYDKMFRTRMVVVVSTPHPRWPATGSTATALLLLLLQLPQACYCCHAATAPLHRAGLSLLQLQGRVHEAFGSLAIAVALEQHAPQHRTACTLDSSILPSQY
jgi:hypothetical protein